MTQPAQIESNIMTQSTFIESNIMTQSALIENNTVTNVIVGTMDGYIPCSDEVGIGWLYDGQTFTPPPPKPLSQEEQLAYAGHERGERIHNGFDFQSNRYQSREQDLVKIATAGWQAQAAILTGSGTVGNLRWHGEASDFAWIAADNTLVRMDAPTVVAFAQAASTHERAHILAARQIKDDILVERTVDILNDPRWPAQQEEDTHNQDS